MGKAKKTGTTAKTSSKATSSSIKAQEAKKKQIFKPILDNPYTQSNIWPFIEPQLGLDIVDLLEVTLKTGKDTSDIVHGFNSTVGRLEKQAAHNRGMHKNKSIAQIKYLFVCKFDMSPPILTSIFPVLSFTSSKNAEDRVKLVQLPRGSMERLSKALGVEHCGVIGLTGEINQAKPLYGMINANVRDVEVPWLNGLFEKNAKVPFSVPNIKQIATTVGAKKSSKKKEK
ncbi:hypothetical protein G210_0103, partial [Candida maltosa Xu316]